MSLLEKSTSFAPLGLVGIGVGMLLTAFFFQYVLGLEPCILCVLQRWPYVLAIALGLIAWRFPETRAAVYLWSVVTFVTGGGIAAYHVGVEQRWWEGTSACGGGSPLGSADPAALMEQLLATPVVACDQIPWALFGISMAGYNVLMSAGFALLCLLVLLRTPLKG